MDEVDTWLMWVSWHCCQIPINWPISKLSESAKILFNNWHINIIKYNHKIKSVFENQNNVGLYRDDGLRILWNLSGPQIEWVRKEIIKIFKECRLSITTKTNLKVVQFLDIELDLINNTYRPYKKLNDNPMYINVNSNHPPTIIKQIPSSINRRLSNFIRSRSLFKNIQPYREALKKSGFQHELTYIEPKISEERNNEKRQRKQKIIWFNLPYSKNVKTNIGKVVFKLLHKHFLPSHSFHKIFNKKSVKISYSCMPSQYF